MAARVLALWVVATLGWWAFAFAPLPSAPPDWLSAARHACFGSAADGLPEPHGWMLLILGPASFLIGIGVLWGADLRRSLPQLIRSRAGTVAVAVLALAAAVEGAWVLQKVEAARALRGWARGIQPAEALPVEYPRQASVAPDFTLVDQHGRTLALAALRGRPVVLTFVFAHCETVCPLVVDTLKRARREGPAATVLLVTLDPWRDTPSTLPAIADRWGLPDDFHVLSSRRVEEVVRIAETYGVAFTRDERTGEIVHAAPVFVIDGEGRLAYTFNNPPAAWVRDGLRRLGATHVLAG
ncbi:MAG TPA: SCO family protein [Vicinamibacterales bacterium]|nr:SCO family protein [Vicinamibacterales bacterium]